MCTPAVARMIGKSLDNMATDHDIEYVLSTSDTFRRAQNISFSCPVDEITRTVIECSDSGVPCVITGIPLGEDDEQSPFRVSTEWIESLCNGQSKSFLVSGTFTEVNSSRRCVHRRPPDGRPLRTNRSDALRRDGALLRPDYPIP